MTNSFSELPLEIDSSGKALAIRLSGELKRAVREAWRRVLGYNQRKLHSVSLPGT